MAIEKLDRCKDDKQKRFKTQCRQFRGFTIFWLSLYFQNLTASSKLMIHKKAALRILHFFKWSCHLLFSNLASYFDEADTVVLGTCLYVITLQFSHLIFANIWGWECNHLYIMQQRTGYLWSIAVKLHPMRNRGTGQVFDAFFVSIKFGSHC